MKEETIFREYLNEKEVGECILDNRYSKLGLLYFKRIKVNLNYEGKGIGSSLMQKLNRFILEKNLPGCTYNLIPLNKEKHFIEKFMWMPFSQENNFYIFNAKPKDKEVLNWAQNNL